MSFYLPPLPIDCPTLVEYKKHAFAAYKGMFGNVGGTHINQILRETSQKLCRKITAVEVNEPDVRNIVQGMDDALDANERVQLAYRGIPLALYEHTLHKHIPLVNYAYTSCTYHLDNAKDFGKIILRFCIPYGMRLHRYTDDDEEKEIVLERNTIFVETGDKKQLADGTYVIDVSICKLV